MENLQQERNRRLHKQNKYRLVKVPPQLSCEMKETSDSERPN